MLDRLTLKNSLDGQDTNFAMIYPSQYYLFGSKLILCYDSNLLHAIEEAHSTTNYRSTVEFGFYINSKKVLP